MYKNKNVYLLSFYSLNLYPSYLKFLNQAKDFGIFDKILIYNQYNLPKNEKFDSLLKNRLVKSRGFGYWCWKPFIILDTLENMNNDDILIYSDIGCHIDKNGLDCFYEYLDRVIDNKILFFNVGFLEKYYTKADLFSFFEKLDDKSFTDTSQRAATVLLFQKNQFTLNFVKEWLDVFYQDFTLADDTPSKIPNFDGFREHRHDQSIFSILSKKYDLKDINVGKYDYTPFLLLRDKENIYDFIIKNALNNLINKVSWFISKREVRDSFREVLNINILNFIKSYLKKENFIFTSSNNFIFDLLIKNLFLVKIKKYIDNDNQFNEIFKSMLEYESVSLILN